MACALSFVVHSFVLITIYIGCIGQMIYGLCTSDMACK